MNKMKGIYIEKVVVNIGCGVSTPLENAKKILESLTKRKVMIIKTKKRSTFNFPKGKEIGCMVTIRDDRNEFLKRLLRSKGNAIDSSSFDKSGNFSFGIKEYIDIPDMEYDPRIGMIGMDVCVTLHRPGYRVKKKKIGSKIGKGHIITKDEAIKFMTENFAIQVNE